MKKYHYRATYVERWEIDTIIEAESREEAEAVARNMDHFAGDKEQEEYTSRQIIDLEAQERALNGSSNPIDFE